MIKFIQGDIFDTECEVLAHGVNCRGGFGSGIAGQIAKWNWEVRDAYLKKFQRTGWNLGEVQIIKTKNPKGCNQKYKYIANIASQYDFARYNDFPPKIHADYPAIKKGLDSLFAWAKDNNYKVAMPLLGCGLAGGDWNTVYKILIELVEKHIIDVEVYYL